MGTLCILTEQIRIGKFLVLIRSNNGERRSDPAILIWKQDETERIYTGTVRAFVKTWNHAAI
jgi:hypothetical protein